MLIIFLVFYHVGPERKNAVIEEKNRRLVAYHESGHALVAIHTPGISYFNYIPSLSVVLRMTMNFITNIMILYTVNRNILYIVLSALLLIYPRFCHVVLSRSFSRKRCNM